MPPSAAWVSPRRIRVTGRGSLTPAVFEVRYKDSVPYTPTAEALRRCKTLRADGQRCGNWAAWADQDGRCASHGGRRAIRPERREYPPHRTRYLPCTCIAYAWPHRPGGGICRWPDEPVLRCTTPAGTHAWPRIRR